MAYNDDSQTWVAAAHGVHGNSGTSAWDSRLYGATAGNPMDDATSLLGLDAKAKQAVQYIAAEATKGAALAAKQEVAKLTLPAALAGFAIGFAAAYFIMRTRR